MRRSESRGTASQPADHYPGQKIAPFWSCRDNREVPVNIDTFGYRGDLPHLNRRGATYFVTFATRRREESSPTERSVVIRSCAYDHLMLHWLECAVVMPDHVHFISTPYEHATIGRVIGRIKGASAYQINRNRNRSGRMWQKESFDRIVRSDEDVRAKALYILDNPVRKGLVKSCEEWAWTWRSWIDCPAG